MSTTLYPGIAFSPQAVLTDNIGAADTIIPVSDVSAFPDAPNLATIGTDEEGETVLYTAKTTSALSGCQRGVEGAAKSWQAGELIGRNFTAKDHGDLIAAVGTALSAASSAQAAAETVGTTMEEAINELNASKQSKLTGSAGQVVGFGADGAAVAQDGWSNINMAPNWYFPDPVNQRREETYTCVSDTAVKTTRCIDRYRIDANLGTTSTLTLEEDGILFEVSRTDDKGRQGSLITSLPPNSLTPGIWTFSVLYSADCKIIPYVYSHAKPGVVPGYKDFPISDTLALAAYTLNLDATDVSGKLTFYAQLNSTVDASAKIAAFKIEKGSRSTLTKVGADGNVVLNDPPPDKAIELLKCQRYFYRLQESRHRVVSFINANNGAIFLFNLPTTMVNTPALHFHAIDDNVEWIRDLNNAGVYKLSEITHKYVDSFGGNVITLNIGLPELMSDAQLLVYGYIDFDSGF